MATTENIEGLARGWQRLRESEPKLRIRDAAVRLGVSEAELLATTIGDGATRLDAEWRTVIGELPRLGRVMCLTRNDNAVHERHGRFREIGFFHGMGQVVGSDIDLRLFMSHWRYGFAVSVPAAHGVRRSLQFFDEHGDAVHKVHLGEDSHHEAYAEIVGRHRAADQSASLGVEPRLPPDPEIADSEIDADGFQRGWLELNDTHDFFPLMRRFRVAREQALRIAPPGHARLVAVAAVRDVLEAAAAGGLEIMVFVGNRGCIQIHTGAVGNIRMLGGEWLNVLDPEFNLHLFLPGVARVWVVRKPTADGLVSSLELFDHTGGNTALMFGKRKPGQPENSDWRELMTRIEREAG